MYTSAVGARTDPHAAHQDVYDAHPDWIAVDAQGNKRRHWAMPELWVTCALGPYNFEFMTAVTREIVACLAAAGLRSAAPTGWEDYDVAVAASWLMKGESKR